jgi:hypothetical protein
MCHQSGFNLVVDLFSEAFAADQHDRAQGVGFGNQIS